MQHLLQDFLSVCVTILGYALIDFYRVKPIDTIDTNNNLIKWKYDLKARFGEKIYYIAT